MYEWYIHRNAIHTLEVHTSECYPYIHRNAIHTSEISDIRDIRDIRDTSEGGPYIGAPMFRHAFQLMDMFIRSPINWFMKLYFLQGISYFVILPLSVSIKLKRQKLADSCFTMSCYFLSLSAFWPTTKEKILSFCVEIILKQLQQKLKIYKRTFLGNAG